METTISSEKKVHGFVHCAEKFRETSIDNFSLLLCFEMGLKLDWNNGLSAVLIMVLFNYMYCLPKNIEY